MSGPILSPDGDNQTLRLFFGKTARAPDFFEIREYFHSLGAKTTLYRKGSDETLCFEICGTPDVVSQAAVLFHAAHGGGEK